MGKLNPVVVITGALAVLFCPLLHRDLVVFSNDAPFGSMHSAVNDYPCYGIVWDDLNYMGGEALGTPPVSFTAALRMPGVFFLVLLTGTLFGIFYNKNRHYNLYRNMVCCLAFPFCVLTLSCCVYPLIKGDDYFFYAHPWMFSLSPLLFNGLILFGITQIIHQTSND